MSVADDGSSLTASQQQYYSTVDAGITLGDDTSATSAIFTSLMDGMTAEDVAALTSSSGGQLVADLPTLADLYNKLSAAEAKLAAEIAAMEDPLTQAAAPAAGGQVKGIANAWSNFVHTALNGDSSLKMNLIRIDSWLKYYMNATLQSVQSYAGNDYKIVENMQAAGSA